MRMLLTMSYKHIYSKNYASQLSYNFDAISQHRPKKHIRNSQRSNSTHAKKLETLSLTQVSYKKNECSSKLLVSVIDHIFR